MNEGALIVDTNDSVDIRFVGHLMVVPLTRGGEAQIDPEEIKSCTPHRQDPKNVTVIRVKDDPFTYFVDLPASYVQDIIADSLRD